MDYFIDESGNTGDLANSNAASVFGDQPIFSLAAIGIANELSFSVEIDRLRARHRIQLSELKASALYDRPEFILEIVQFLCAERFPYFVEVVDKKYFLSTHITSRQLLPSIAGVSEDAMLNYVRNVVADYLYERAPDEVFVKFVAACKQPSDATLRAELDALLEFSRIAPDDEEPAIAVFQGAMATLGEYQALCNSGRRDAYLEFLPIPDQSKHGKPIWVLPNLSAFTNIYARLNRYMGGNLSAVRLVHDGQVHFDDILRSSKEMAESLGDRAEELFTPHSDFNFRESASLIFSCSATSTGLQVADIVAGFCMRFAKEFFSEGKHPSQAAHEAYSLLIRYSNLRSGVGINQVVSTRRADLLNRTGVRR
jgi:hypothetical protein